MVAVDWGTTALRAARLDAHGQVMDVRSTPQGILQVPSGQFPAVFDAMCADWMQADGGICLMSGMVGSRQGWFEAPYCPCPAGFNDMAQAMAWVMPGQVAIVPGLSCEHPAPPDSADPISVHDVMRGEEVQVLGALDLLGRQDATLVLPGTHSKWVSVRARRIESFSTFMTGEFYALLRQHSILARTLPASDGDLDTSAFDRGIAQALAHGSLLSTAFSTRTLSLFHQMPPEALPSYLSGLVIGEELRARPTTRDGGPVVIVGSSALTQRYARALSLMNIPCECVGGEATWRGLWALAQTLH